MLIVSFLYNSLVVTAGAGLTVHNDQILQTYAYLLTDKDIYYTKRHTFHIQTLIETYIDKYTSKEIFNRYFSLCVGGLLNDRIFQE